MKQINLSPEDEQKVQDGLAMKRVVVSVKNRTIREVLLTPAEEQAARDARTANATAAEAEAELQGKRDRRDQLRKEILDAQAANEVPDPLKVDEFKALKAELDA